MRDTGLWEVDGATPRRLGRSSVELEKHLEDWIERDPELVQAGLTIAGRQVYVEAGPLDLLGIDSQGRWVVIEIKRGAVRRETIAQGLDYVSCIATMSDAELGDKVRPYMVERYGSSAPELELLEQAQSTAVSTDGGREVGVLVVGTGADPGLQRMIDFLSGQCAVPISVVTFEVFAGAEGRMILARHLTEADTVTTEKKRPSVSVEDVCRQADSLGVGAEFRRALQAAESFGLHLRPYATSVMCTPPANKTRCLFTVWSRGSGEKGIKAYVCPQAFEEFYPVSAQEAEQYVGEYGWHYLDGEGVEKFVSGLCNLKNAIESCLEEEAVREHD